MGEYVIDDGRHNFCETCGEERLGVKFCPECGDAVVDDEHLTGKRCAECTQLVAEKQDLREALAGLRDAGRQAYRQIGLFLEDGQRERLIVAQAILDPKAEQEPQCIEYCGDLRHPDGCEPVGPDDEYRGQ